MCEAIPPVPQYAFLVWCSVKQKAKGQLDKHIVAKLITSKIKYIQSEITQRCISFNI